MFNFISGGRSVDDRGQIRFVNEFDMRLVKRFYIIKNINLDTVRGWRGHQIEQRWFYVLSGAFELSLIKIDDWKIPSRDSKIVRTVISSHIDNIIHIPPGYCTAFRALELESELLVFADYEISHSAIDDYTWDLSYFKKFT